MYVKNKIAPFKLKSTKVDLAQASMFSMAQLRMAFEAGREFHGGRDKDGSAQNLEREQWEKHLRHRSFHEWADKNI